MAPQIPNLSPDQLPTPPPEVTWQTCFWILITLSLNTMSQPSGRILSNSSHNHFYLRSSPFICLADALSIGIRIIYMSIGLRVSISRSFRLLILHRFDEFSGLPVSAANTAWLRWLLFVLGPLPQGIRLASFGGVVWTKVFGFSFTVSWIVVEVLLFSASRISERVSISLSAELSTTQSRKYERLNGDLEDFETHIAVTSTFCTFIPCFYYKLMDDFENPARWVAKLGETGQSLQVLWAYVSGFVVLYCCWLIFLGIEWICERNLRLGRFLLVVHPTESWRGRVVDTVDSVAVLCFVLFLVDLGAVLLSYGVYYDPTGTENFGWAAVFG